MSKFDKFTMVDPLGESQEEASTQEVVAEEVNRRMGRAVDELKDKYDSGGRGFDSTTDAQPTGTAYARARQEQAERRKAAREQRRAAEVALRAEDAELAAQLKASALINGEVDSADEDEDEEDSADVRRGGEGVDSDDELLAGLEKDPEIQRIRERRLRELKRVHEARAENIAKGHGQYRDILQDEFLPEVTSSEKVVVHFYHKDFQRCKMMDHRLSELAPRHLETKFLRLDAEKAPFFVAKLQVKVLPTVVCFIDGIAVHHIIGFEGLTKGLPKDKVDEWPVSNLARELALAKVIVYSRQDTAGGESPEDRNGDSFGTIRAGFNDGRLLDGDV